jgi:hypothetical protein
MVAKRYLSLGWEELKLQVCEKKLVKQRLTWILEVVQFRMLSMGKILYFMLVKY